MSKNTIIASTKHKDAVKEFFVWEKYETVIPKLEEVYSDLICDSPWNSVTSFSNPRILFQDTFSGTEISTGIKIEFSLCHLCDYSEARIVESRGKREIKPKPFKLSRGKGNFYKHFDSAHKEVQAWCIRFDWKGNEEDSSARISTSAFVSPTRNDHCLNTDLLLLAALLKGYASFGVFELNAFQRLEASGKGNMLLSSRRQALRVMLQLEADARLDLKLLLKDKIGRIHISTDHWTARYHDQDDRHFGTLVICFCDKEMNFHERTIGFRSFKDAKNVPSVRTWTEAVLNEFDLQWNDVCTISVDFPDNMNGLTSNVNMPRICCLNHRLNQVFASVIGMEFLAQALAVRRHMTGNGDGVNAVVSLLEEVGLRELPELNENCWLSRFRIIDEICCKWFGRSLNEDESSKIQALHMKVSNRIFQLPATSEVAKHLKKFDQTLMNIIQDHQLYKDVHELFKPWQTLFERIQGEHETLPKALLSILQLMKLCGQHNPNDTNAVLRLKQDIFEGLKSRIFVDELWDSWVFTALFLDGVDGWDVINILTTDFHASISEMNCVSQTRFQNPQYQTIGSIAQYMTIQMMTAQMHNPDELPVFEDPQESQSMEVDMPELYTGVGEERSTEQEARLAIGKFTKAVQNFRKQARTADFNLKRFVNDFFSSSVMNWNLSTCDALRSLVAETTSTPAATASSERKFSLTPVHISFRRCQLLPKTLTMLNFGWKNIDLMEKAYIRMYHQRSPVIPDLLQEEDSQELDNIISAPRPTKESAFDVGPSQEDDQPTTNTMYST